MRIALALGAVAVVLFLVLRPEGDQEAETAPTIPTTTEGAATTAAPDLPDVIVSVFQGGRVRGGVQTYSFSEGDRIWLVVRSDVPITSTFTGSTYSQTSRPAGRRLSTFAPT